MRPAECAIRRHGAASLVPRLTVYIVVLFISAWKGNMAEVGFELRRIREAAGISGSAVARDLGWSQSKISRVETGRFGASVSEVAELLAYYGVAEEVRAEILGSVARSSGLEGAWVVSAGGAPRRQAAVEAIESRVKRLSQYQTSWIPGLLQTAAYANAICQAAGLKANSVVPARLERQQLLAHRRGVRYEAILDESTLRRSPRATSADMAEQMTHLLELLDVGYVDVRVLEVGGVVPTFAAGSFVLYEFKTGSPVVLCENQTADLYLSAERDITAYQKLFRGLHKNALDVAGSRRAIEAARRHWAS
ncbi:helix-turn-helix transcriptional regulator [Terrabacter carboxydivorans]|uniref:Helix-turn-helix transcriptional regulator n=2 Tax=Terrabacter carboxydivorans TaxID=619730 RepID=A0ABN3MED8_9MICO